MELILNQDPLEELRGLLSSASSLPQNKVNFISVSRSEMKAIVTHAKAGEVIFDYINQQKFKLDKVRGKIQALKNNQNIPENSLPKQEYFDRMSEFELEEARISEYVPKVINQNGIEIRSTIK